MAWIIPAREKGAYVRSVGAATADSLSSAKSTPTEIDAQRPIVLGISNQRLEGMETQRNFGLSDPSEPRFAGGRDHNLLQNPVQIDQTWFIYELRSGTPEPVPATCAVAIPDLRTPRSAADSVR